MGMTFEQFLYGIGQAETGGYSNQYAVNTGNGMYGKYQVNGIHLGSGDWAMKYFKRPVSTGEYLRNPALQEQLVRMVMADYSKKYKGNYDVMAAAWNAGEGHVARYGGVPPFSETQNYIKRMRAAAPKAPPSAKKNTSGPALNATAPAASGGGSTGRWGINPSTGQPFKSEADKAAYGKTHFGYVEGFLNATPEISKLFNQYVKEDWSDEMLEAKLRGSKWWKTHSKSDREAMMKAFGDPATADAEMEAAKLKVRVAANQIGLREYKGVNAWYSKLAYQMVHGGWSDQQLRYEIGKKLDYVENTEHFQGQAEEYHVKLHSLAYDMGVSMSNAWYKQRVKNVAMGIANEEDYLAEIRAASKAQFPQWAKQIDGGKTVADLASPYMQSMSQILELPQGKVNLFDKTIRNAMNYKDPKTGSAGTKPLWQFETELRKDERWKGTKNAQDSVMSMTTDLLQSFGLLA